MKARQIKPREFAENIGETENIVRKWAYGQRQPTLDKAVRIEIATGGQVAPRDLLLKEPLRAPARRNVKPVEAR